MRPEESELPELLPVPERLLLDSEELPEEEWSAKPVSGSNREEGGALESSLT